MRRLVPVLVLATAGLLGGCKRESPPAGAPQQAQQPTSTAKRTLKVGATPVPHAEILRAAAPLAAKEGVEVQVVEFTDYVQPNVALADKQLDANYFQHVPYLERFSADRGLALASMGAVHLEPLAVYSVKHASLQELPEGARVSLPADPSNAARALQLLAREGLVKLREGAGMSATARDVVDNPRKLDLKEIDAEQLPRTLEDVGAAVINANYFLEARKNLKLDAKVLARETAQGNPYANVLVVRRGDEARAELQVLLRALQSPDVRRFIESTYGGAVTPAF